MTSTTSLVKPEEPEQSPEDVPGKKKRSGNKVAVAIQGYEGSFHHLAANHFFNNNSPSNHLIANHPPTQL